MEKKLPIFNLEITSDLEDDVEVDVVSLVDRPAIERQFLLFKNDKFIDPIIGEGKDKFLPRCIEYVINEGKETEQAVAICNSIWTEHFAEESYNDYPEAAVNNAKRALKWAEENGWGSCGEATGKLRANQIANKENLTRETLARISGFRRHQQHKDVPYSEGCGGLMWDAWGGEAMIDWAERKLKQIDRQIMESDNIFGGEGSGCQGDNCGRPKGSGSEINYTKNSKENVDLTIQYGKKNGINIEVSDKIPKSMVAMGSPSSQKIFINEKHPYWKNPIENQKKSFESGILSSPNPLHVIHHETSHLKHKNIAQTWLNKEYQQKIAGKVGGYAKTNPSEFVAETYAGMKSGIKYDEDVMNLYKIVGGKKEDFSIEEINFTEQIGKQSFAIQNEEERIISGPLMLADTPIYRNDDNGEYYVVFTKETIKKIAQRFFKKGYQSNVNLMHEQGNLTEGLTMFESWLKDDKRGIKAMKGFEDVPDGSWFGSFKVDNDEVWNQIKAGKVRGFSVEGQFNYRKTGDKRLEQLWENVLGVLAQIG